MQRIHAPILSLVLLSLLHSILLSRETHAGVEDNPAFLTIYVGQGTETNPINLFPDLVSSDLNMDASFLGALGYFHPLGTPGPVQVVFDILRVPNSRLGFETVVGKHNGLQHNWELGGTLQLRFAPWRLSSLWVRPAFGLGLSHAIGNPAYEDGPKDDPERRYHLLNFNTYELEWGWGSAPSFSLVTRLHHRSGIFGLIAPPIVGSNFLTVGLRICF